MEDWIAILRARRDIVLSILGTTPGLRCATPEGAFYAFVNVVGLLGCTTRAGATIRNDLDVATYLLDEAGVGVVHGAAFGASPYVRIAYAVDTDTLRAACERIRSACMALTNAPQKAGAR